MTTKAQDYTNSAVNLYNPPEIGAKLAELHEAEEKIKIFEGTLANLSTYQSLKEQERFVITIRTQIKDMVDAQGSFQDLENESYAVKYKRISKVYHVEPFKEHYQKYVPAVVVETINAKALEGMIKGKLIEEADLKMYQVITEDIGFAYYVR